MYKLTKTNVIRLSDNANIPLDSGNMDYVRYLEWVQLGNLPEKDPEPTQEELLAKAKLNALDRVTSYSKEKRYQIAGTTDEIEITGWSNKARIAYSIKNNTATDNDKEAIVTEMNLIGLTNTPLEVYADKIISKAQAFSNVIGLIDGLKKVANKAINDCTTVEQVEPTLEAIKQRAEEFFIQVQAKTA